VVYYSAHASVYSNKIPDMKYASNRNQRIAYDLTGQGPAVVLQHGFLDNRRSWQALGYVAALVDKFTVITIDSLGHGDSDKPSDAECYTREQRANDIAAVLNAESIDRAHYVGYSMGGWLGMGFLAHHPQRLLSITIGGWDPDEQADRPLSVDIDQFIEMARSVAPELVEWVTPDVKVGLAGCLAALRVAEIEVDTLINCKLPVHLWTGNEDLCFEPLKKLSAKIPDSTLSEVKGDHIAAMAISNSVSAEAIRRFIESV
jgi:pimeloyl-ACP methyl ester carboxylesterase